MLNAGPAVCAGGFARIVIADDEMFAAVQLGEQMLAEAGAPRRKITKVQISSSGETARVRYAISAASISSESLMKSPFKPPFSRSMRA